VIPLGYSVIAWEIDISRGYGCPRWGRKLSPHVKTIPYEHTYVSFNLEKGKGHMTSSWMAKNYMKSFRDNIMLRARDLKTMVKN